MTDSLSYTPDPQNHHCTVPGLFIVFEGGDGAGKSTQLQLLATALRKEGHDVVTTREPGGTEIGEKLRELVLEHGNGTIDTRTEALIFAASRAAHAEQLIRPAVQAGKIVLCDRYIDSSAAYQGAGRHLGIGNITNLSLWATGNLLPHLTLVLDVPLDAGRHRTTVRGEADRMESEPDDFHAAIHRTFTELAGAHPARYAVINGEASVDTVHRAVLESVKPLLKGLGA